MVIPKQLLKSEFRFVLITPQKKAPMEFNWQKSCNYKYDEEKLLTHKGNLGIVCGFGGLVVLDIDDKIKVNEFDKIDTFTVKTGSGGRHLYFKCNQDFKKSIYVLSCGELRVKNSQVLIPNSIHPNGNKYEVLKDIPIKEVSKNYLKNILINYLKKDENQTDTSRSGQDWREICDMVEAGYNFDEADMEMKLTGSSRWNEESMNYKLSTYCNALNHIKNVKKKKIRRITK